MFRKLGYPWELQMERLRLESEQWRDLIFSDGDYEIVRNITLEQAIEFFWGMTYS
tara:strand:- start:14075 stop:14239 length:165 start_codon:yes stop_codon:yes gene_type:complete